MFSYRYGLPRCARNDGFLALFFAGKQLLVRRRKANPRRETAPSASAND